VLLLGGLNGLALTAHNLALLAAPIYALAVLALCRRGRLRWASPVLLAAGWAVGASGFLVMVARAAASEGVLAAAGSALFGQSWRSDVLGGSLRAVALGAGCVAYNFPNAALPLAAAGLLTLRRRRAKGPWRCLAALAGIYLLFAIRYGVTDQFMFFLPFYAVVAVLAGVGCDRLASHPRAGGLAAVALGSLLLGPVLYAAMPVVARATNLPLPGRKDLPFRDHGRYWLSPWKAGEDSAASFARAALSQAPPDAVIVADGTSRYPLLWTRHAAGGSSRPAILSLAEAHPTVVPVGTPDVFVVSSLPGYHPPWMRRAAAFQKDSQDAILFRVVWRRAGPSQPAP
jgi:hypothetical protein